MLKKRYLGWITIALIGLIACTEGNKTGTQEDSHIISHAENRLGEYPFAIGFGASAEQIFAKEGKVDPAKSNEFLAIYEYPRTWHGYMGTLSYLYLKDDNAVVALSFDIPLITGVTLDEVLASAKKMYVKGTSELYELFFELEEGEGKRLLESPEHDQLFFKDHYAINITQEDSAGVINILYSYVNFDHDHRHADGYDHHH